MAHDPYSSLRFPEYRPFLVSMSVVFGGAMTLLTVAVVVWRAPQLRRLQRIGS